MSDPVVARRFLQAKIRTSEDFGGSVVDMLNMSSEHKIAYKKSIDKLMKISPTFKNIDKEIIETGIMSGNIPVKKYKEGSILINDGESDCDHFFILIHGKLLVVKDEQEIARIDSVGSFGVMGYINGEKREGTVIADSDSVVLVMKRSYIEVLPIKVQNILLKNLTAEMSKIIAAINEERLNTQKSCVRNLWVIKQEVSQQVNKLKILNG